MINDETRIILDNNSITEENEITFNRMLWMFIIGCIIGTLYEYFFIYFRTGIWESRRGVIYGPFNPVYGFGFVIAVLFLKRYKNVFVMFIIGAIAFGTLEYILNYLQEYFLGARSWDYSKLITNINGRTTVIYSLFWSFFGVLIVKLLYPLVVKGLNKIPKTLNKYISLFMVIFLIFDMGITGLALLRQAERKKGYPPSNFIEMYIDEHYNDARLKKIFPNMKFKEH